MFAERLLSSFGIWLCFSPRFAEELRMPHRASEHQPRRALPRGDAQYHPGRWTTKGPSGDSTLPFTRSRPSVWLRSLCFVSWVSASVLTLLFSPFLALPFNFGSPLLPDTSTFTHKHSSAEECMQSILTAAAWSGDCSSQRWWRGSGSSEGRRLPGL